jgi:ketosteroid isomerase-like protein
MDQQQLRDLGQTFIDALHGIDRQAEGAIDRMVDLFGDEARLTNAALILAGDERSGREGVRQFWREYQQTFREAETTFSHLTTDEGAVGLFWTTRGTDVAGDTVDYDGVSLLEFGEDGKISSFHGYYDTRQLSRTVNAAER